MEKEITTNIENFTIVEQSAYKQSLANRHVQMIAFGGAIGVGLFLGTGERLTIAGPGLIFSFIIAGIIAYFLMRALGELTLYRQTSGSFVSYTREFFGPKAAYVVGWMYWLNWATAGISELTAIGTYITSKWLHNTPRWIPVLISLLVIMIVNFLSVRVFGEFEFIASVLKVLAIIVFLIVGTLLVIFSVQINGQTAAISNLWSHGGFFPKGIWSSLLILNSVVFSYAAIELVGVAAGEMEDAAKQVPKAVRSVIFRIFIFYVGSITLLCMILPWNNYKADQSPFTMVFSYLHIPGASDIIQLILIIAALSSINSGLYSTGRILRNLGLAHQAPKFTTKMSKNGIPVAGILMTSIFYFFGVLINIIKPSEAFNLALSMAAVSIIATWTSIFACHLKYRYLANKGLVNSSSYPAPGYPITSAIGILFLFFVLFAVSQSHGIERYSVYMIPILALFLILGWMTLNRNNSSKLK